MIGRRVFLTQTNQEQKKQGWLACLFSYAEGSKKELLVSMVLSIISIVSGLLPYYCLYRVLDSFILGKANTTTILTWCALALAAYVVKVLSFGLSTGLSHYAAYTILEGLRLRAADRFLHAPLGEVMSHSIGEIKGVIVDKIEEIEPPLAHMVPEGSGHIVLPVISFAALLVIDWRVALASLVTVPLSMVCMILTFQISGKNFEKYNQSNAFMNSTIVEYIEGIEVIKAFGRTGMSYEKYAGAIRDYKTFVIKWFSSTWVTMKLAFALFPATLLGTLPASLLLAANGAITVAQAALCVMLSMSMVGSLAKLEVFSSNLKQVQMTVEELQSYLSMEELPEPETPAILNGYDVQLKNVHFSYTGDSADEFLQGIYL